MSWDWIIILMINNKLFRKLAENFNKDEKNYFNCCFGRRDCFL